MRYLLSLALLLVTMAAQAAEPPKYTDSSRAVVITYLESAQLAVSCTQFSTQTAPLNTTTLFVDTASDAKAIRYLLFQCPDCSATAVFKIATSATRTGDAVTKTSGWIVKGHYFYATGPTGKIELSNLYLRSIQGTSIWCESTDADCTINAGIGTRANPK